MKLIDRYIIKSFFVWMVLWFTAVAGLYIVGDLTTNQDYLSIHSSRPLLAVLGEYYLYRGLLGLDVGLPLLILISSLMVINGMLRRNELIALQAMGVPFRRLMIPILSCALVLCTAAFWAREFFIPRHTVEINLTPQELAERQEEQTIFRATDALTRIKIGGKSINPSEGVIQQPDIILPTLLSKYGNEIIAERAVWHVQDETFPNGYLLQGVQKPAELLSSPSIDLLGKVLKSSANSLENDSLNGEDNTLPITGQDSTTGSNTQSTSTQTVVLYSPFDTPSLNDNECFLATGVAPIFLAVEDIRKLNTSTLQLISAARNPSLSLRGKDLEVRVHKRIVQPIADLLPLLLGLPIFFLATNKKAIKGITYALLAAGLFTGVSYCGNYFGPKIGMPIVGAWLPLFVFIPLSVNLLTDLWKR